MADVMEDADVGMVQARNSPRLALEALAALVVAGKMFRQHLDSDGPVEARVFGTIHLTHAASSERGENFVRP
jgi:hypothetical protein